MRYPPPPLIGFALFLSAPVVEVSQRQETSPDAAFRTVRTVTTMLRIDAIFVHRRRFEHFIHNVYLIVRHLNSLNYSPNNITLTFPIYTIKVYIYLAYKIYSCKLWTCITVSNAHPHNSKKLCSFLLNVPIELTTIDLQSLPSHRTMEGYTSA